MSGLVGIDIELDDSVGSLNPTLPQGAFVCMLVKPLWCDLGCCSRTVEFVKAAVPLITVAY